LSIHPILGTARLRSASNGWRFLMRLWFAMPVALATAAVGLGLFAPASAPPKCVGPSLIVPGASTGKPTTEP
jgi:hypothetical protein